MIPYVVDFECTYTPTINLKKLTLRSYLAQADVLGMAIALGDGEVEFFDHNQLTDQSLLDDLRQLSEDPDYVFVAHNASFDARVWRLKLGLPQPTNVLCTLELSCAAYPNQPGGYSLENLARTLNLDWEKVGKAVNVGRMTPAELAHYCKGDVIGARKLYHLCLPRLHPDEANIARITNQVRELHFEVDIDAVHRSLDEFSKIASDSAALAIDELAGDAGEEGKKEARTAFGWDEDGKEKKVVRSVKPADMKRLLCENLGFDTQSISFKKINPEKLRGNDRASRALKATERANKALFHKRRSKVFAQTNLIDAELGYFRAHTGRFSSPNSGRGLNLHNCVSGHSQILTNRGWVPILWLRDSDRVWDGTAFVAHGGVTYEGERECLPSLGRARMTAEHPVWIGQKFQKRGELTHCQSVRALAAGCCSILRCLRADVSVHSVEVAENRLSVFYANWTQLKVAEAALSGVAMRTIRGSSIPISSRSTVGATTTWESDTGPAATAGLLASGTVSTRLGAISVASSPTAVDFLGGMIARLKWIASIAKATTSPATLDSFARAITAATVVLVSSRPPGNLFQTTRDASVFRTSGRTTFSGRAVFDVLDAGPRSRFQCGGLVVSNCSKHDKRIAKAIRSMFRLPSDVCFVRADLANVEYRHGGLLFGCEHVLDLFGRDILADPYSAFGTAATGHAVTKAMPVRQVWKAGVLQLEFLAGVEGWIRHLLKMLADFDQYKVSLADLEKVAQDNGWLYPNKPHVTRAATRTMCPQIVATVAYHTHTLFHKIHPEFRRKTLWIQDTIGKLNQCLDSIQANRVLDAAYGMYAALDRNLVDLQWSEDFEGRTVRVRCGDWPAATVTWRDIDVRAIGTDGRIGLTSMTARKGYWPLSPSILIENVCQSSARNALCSAMLKFDAMGHPYQLSVHDEILLVVPKTRDAVLKAKSDILSVLGPHRSDWATVVNPDEINVSSSLYEVELGKDWWAKLAAGDESLLEGLP